MQLNKTSQMDNILLFGTPYIGHEHESGLASFGIMIKHSLTARGLTDKEATGKVVSWHHLPLVNPITIHQNGPQKHRERGGRYRDFINQSLES